MKKILFLLLFGVGILNAQTGYKGSSNGSPITIDISDSRYAFAEGSKTVVVFQTKNVTLDSTLSSFIGDACEAYISMTSKKKQGVLKAGQVFSVNRAFVDKVLPISGGCVILTKDPSINFEVSTSYATVSAAMIQCASSMSQESTDADNGLYLDGTTVKMGGYLTENTVIYGDDHYMIIDSLIGFSVKAINNDDAEAYLTLSTNLAQPSSLSHYEMATGNYAAISLDGDGVSNFKSADDNDLDYAEVTVSYEDLKASMKAVVSDGTGYSEVSVASNVIVHASDDISIDASGQIDIMNNAGSGINIGNGNSPVRITPEGSPAVVSGWIMGYSDEFYNVTAIDPAYFGNFANTDLTWTGNRVHSADTYSTTIGSSNGFFLENHGSSNNPVLKLTNSGFAFSINQYIGNASAIYTPIIFSDLSAVGQGNYAFGSVFGENIGSNVVNNSILGKNILPIVGNNSDFGSNVAIGKDLFTALTGSQRIRNNVAIGTSIGISLDAGATSWENNIAIGNGSQGNAIGGNYNVSLGYGSLKTSADAENVVAIGSGAAEALQSGTGSIFIGLSAGSLAGTSPYNIGIGASTLQDVNGGQENIAIGSNAATNLTSGVNNVAIGYQAASSITTEDYNTIIGSGADINAGVEYSTAIGTNAFVATSNSLVLGENGTRVGIGTSSPNAVAILELSSTTKGFLPPRMTATQASAITVGANEAGLMLFVNSTNGTFTSIGWWGWDGSAWYKF